MHIAILKRAVASALGSAIALASSLAMAQSIPLDRMPADLETRYALSALPPALRAEAGIYLLDPEKGYSLARKGTNGIACLIERTAWELADFRDDIYIPLCYDAAGLDGHFRVIMEVATLRAGGIQPIELKLEVERRYGNGTYTVPQKAGLSYMIAPVMRTVGPPDMKVLTMAMPHFMYYAPGVTNADIGALPDLADPATLLYPFIDRQGNAEQSYMIQLVGATEKAEILSREKDLLADLCAYRELLCVDAHAHKH